MRLTPNSAGSLQFIYFDGDEDGFEGLGFPMLRDEFLSKDLIEQGTTSFHQFRSLDLNTASSPDSLYEAWLFGFCWSDSREVDALLTINFELRNSPQLFSLTYKNPKFVADTGLTTEFQGLYVQALGICNGKYRHEFLFQDRFLIIESDDFSFSKVPHDLSKHAAFKQRQ